MNVWSPLADPRHSRWGTRPERCALQGADAGPSLAISGSDQPHPAGCSLHGVTVL